MAARTALKIAAGFLVATAVAAAAAAIIVPRLLNPENYRTRILSMAENVLNRRVSYHSAAFSGCFIPSLVFRGVTIAEKAGDATFLEAPELTIRLSLLPLLCKEVRLQEITVDRPVLLLSRDRTGASNVDDLTAGRGGEPSRLKVVVESILIKNGLVRFTDRTSGHEGFAATLEDLNLEARGLARGERSVFSLSTRIAGERGPAAVSVSGTARIPARGESLLDAQLDLKLAGRNIDAWRYWPYYGRHVPFERVRGELDIEGVFKGKPTEFATAGEIRIRGLRFNYPGVFNAPLTPSVVRLACEVILTPKDLAVKRFDLAVDALRVTGSCELRDIRSGDLRITALAATSPFRLEEFHRYIPYGVIPRNTAGFIERHITGGVYRLDEGRLDGRVSQIRHMGRGTNYNVLFIRGRVEKGVVSFGPSIPSFNNIKGRLELQGKDFLLKGMTGNFGNSPFSMEGKIAGYPIRPATYPFTMAMIPGKAEVAWLFRQKESVFALYGDSLLHLSGDGPVADYRLAGSWELGGAEYRYRQVVHKPAGMPNRLRFTGRLRKSDVRVDEVRYELPPLELTSAAAYRYGERDLTFTADTNSFAVDRLIPAFPALERYRPAGTLRAHLRGSGNPGVRDGMRLEGDVALTEFSARPSAQIEPLRGMTGSIHVTEAALETEELTGRVGESPFSIRGRVIGNADPTAELSFTSPRLHPEDLGFYSVEPVPAMENVSGSVSFEGGSLTIPALSGQVNRSKFTMNGQIHDLSAPKIALRIDFPFLAVEELAPYTRLKRAGEKGKGSRPVTLKTEVTCATGSFRETSFNELDTHLFLEGGRLVVESFRLGMFGGTVSGSGGIHFASGGGPDYQVSYRLDQIDIPQFLRATGEPEHASGKLSAEGELTAVGKDWEQVKRSGRGSAEIRLSDCMIPIPANADGQEGPSIPIDSLHARLSHAGKMLGIRQARIETLGGVVTGEADADFGIPEGPGYRLSCRMKGVDAARFLALFHRGNELYGTLALEADLAARGDNVAALKKSVRGALGMHFEKGMINKYPVLASVLSLLNVSKLVDFQMPDLATTGFPYDHIDVNFSLKDGIASTSDLSITSPSLDLMAVGKTDLVRGEIDFKIGVHPLQRVDRIVSRIPFIGWILTGRSKRFLVTYFDARGNWSDPKVSAVMVSSLSGVVYDVLKRAFDLPGAVATDPERVIMGD